VEQLIVLWVTDKSLLSVMKAMKRCNALTCAFQHANTIPTFDIALLPLSSEVRWCNGIAEHCVQKTCSTSLHSNCLRRCLNPYSSCCRSSTLIDHTLTTHLTTSFHLAWVWSNS